MQDNEYRFVCAQYGHDGHQMHHYGRSTAHKAQQDVIDWNHKATTRDDFFYKGCAPYVAQVRPNVEWEALT